MNVYPFIEAEKRAAHQDRRAGTSRGRASCWRSPGPPTTPTPPNRPPAARHAPAPTPCCSRGSSRSTPAPTAPTAPRGCTPELTDEGRCARPQARRPADARGRDASGGTQRRWRKTTIADPAAPARAGPDRARLHPRPVRLDPRWCGDITYIRTWEGWLYLATVIDIASRRVVGWATADHLRTDLVDDALREAVATRRPARRGDLPLRPRLPVHQRPIRRRSKGTGRSRSRSGGPVNAGTTPSPSRSSPPSRASCSTTAPGRPTPPRGPRSSTTSRAGTTPADGTPPSATSAPTPTRTVNDYQAA